MNRGGQPKCLLTARRTRNATSSPEFNYACQTQLPGRLARAALVVDKRRNPSPCKVESAQNRFAPHRVSGPDP